MGYYINEPKMGARFKAATLVEEYGAEQTLPTPPSNVPPDKALVCVVENGLFDAAAFVFSDREYHEVIRPDGRPRTWLLMDRAWVVMVTGYKEDGSTIDISY